MTCAASYSLVLNYFDCKHKIYFNVATPPSCHLRQVSGLPVRIKSTPGFCPEILLDCTT